jgi:hypothetical protein
LTEEAGTRRGAGQKVSHASESLDGREKQLIALAVTSVEARIRNGTASAQELLHFLKLASSRERLEQTKLENEAKLAEARIAEAAAGQRTDGMYERAILAMRSYAGHGDVDAL